MSRLVLVGEAPGGSGTQKEPALDPSGASGQALMRMMELSPVEYAYRTHRYNVFHTPDGGNPWSAARALLAAAALVADSLDYDDRVVLLGARVARAFEAEDLSLYEWVEQGAGFWLARVPHPSGRNRALNDPVERERMRVFLLEATAYCD